MFEETGRVARHAGVLRSPSTTRSGLAAPSGDACRELWQFWQKTDPDTGALAHDFTDPEWNTRFLGDLYQDLSETARKRYALLQTPVFVEQFILDRTLTPAIETFGFSRGANDRSDVRVGAFPARRALSGCSRALAAPSHAPGQPAQSHRPARAQPDLHGVDLNPNVVAIARFRLLLAALAGERGAAKLQATRFGLPAACHGRGTPCCTGRGSTRPGKPYVRQHGRRVFDGHEVFRGRTSPLSSRRRTAARCITSSGRQYHAVVGNPPYITVKDRALSELYRERYGSCSGKYSLSVPFMERFFDLALRGDGTAHKPAGFVGQITSNSFMKREFGKKLIETFLPRWDLTHVLDTAGAYIPGHGTPTVILFGRNQLPVRETIRTVLGINVVNRPRPTNPAQRAWSGGQLPRKSTKLGSISQWVSASRLFLAYRFSYKHPWSIGGGGSCGTNTGSIDSLQQNQRISQL